MKAALNALLLLLAHATDKALARYVQYLKAENQVLRSKLPRVVPVTPPERRRLVKFGRPLGTAYKELVGIVSPRTFLRWLNAEGRQPARRASPRRPGRPRTPEDVRELVLRLARENDWGYTRILGELKKLGVRKISRSTVVNLLRENGLDPGPRRGEDTWDDFIKRHAATLWSCDFFIQRVWTLRGVVEVYVLFFLNVASRKAHVVGMTAHPDRAWVAQQARNACLYFAEQPTTERPAVLLRDNDRKYGPGSDTVFAAEGVLVHAVTPCSPNLNARAERLIQTLRRECVGRFVFFGEAHLRHVLREFVAWYHRERPHQALGNAPPCGPPDTEGPTPRLPTWPVRSGWAGCCGTTGGPPDRRGGTRYLHTAPGRASGRGGP